MSETYKVILLGEEDVGKNDIIKTFGYGTLVPDSVISSTENLVRKTITLLNNESVSFYIWDTAG